MSESAKLESLRQKISQVNSRIARAEALRQLATQNLEAAKLEADLEFGTSDPDALDKLAEEASRQAEALLARTAAQLEEAERQLSLAEKALQP